MTEIIINFSSSATTGPLTYNGNTYFEAGNTATADTGGSAVPIAADLPNLADGTATGISFFQTQAFDRNGFSGVSPPYSGDASWVGNAGTDGNAGVTYWFTQVGETRIFGFGNLDPTHTYRIEGYSARDTTGTRNTAWTVAGTTETINAIANTSVTAIFTGVAPDGSNQILVSTTEAGGDSNFGYTNALRLVDEGVASGPTLRKGSQFTVEETLAGNVVSATLNGNAITVDSHVGTTVTLTDSGSGITTSGEYTLVLTDDSATPQTENITVQVNVVGLASFNINKDGADQGSLTDVEFIFLTGAAGSRAINDQIINITTTVAGDTGPIEITDTALNSGDTIMVAQQSATVGGGAFHPATLELI